MRLPLLGGAYQSRSLIASAQRSINLYCEVNPQSGSPPVPVTHYPTPGLRLVTNAPNAEKVRTLYRATSGALFAVVGAVVYSVSASFIWTVVGTIPYNLTPVSMADNGMVIVLVDGSPTGYAIDMTALSFATISATAFYGALKVDYLDGYFIFDRPGTTQFYISLANVTYAMLTSGTAFDPLDIAAKSGSADSIVTLAAIHGELWLIGELTSEIWANTGAPDFTFGRIQGAFIDHGCAAPYSLSQQDISLFWLAQDRQGNGVVVRSNGYSVDRISTHAIEQDIQSYPKIDDAIGYCYQQQGHAFYVLIFPSISRTWVYEMGTGLWHERASIDGNGELLRHRSNCFAFAYEQNLVGDFQNGSVYALDTEFFTDNGIAIPRIRTFPHSIRDGKRVRYDRFVADMEVGQMPGTLTSDPPQIFLRWSDTRGATYGNAVGQSMGSAGQFYTQPLWSRLGIARDRIFELSWSVPCRTSLNGAFIDLADAAT